MHRDADHARLVGDGPLDRLLDPPVRVGRELVAALVLELLHGLHQADVPLLDQIHEGDPVVQVLLGDVDHQTQVGQNHRVPRMVHVALVALGLRDQGLDLGLLAVLASVAQQLGVERLHVVQRPLATTLRSVQIGLEAVVAASGGKLDRDLGQSLTRLLQLASQLDFLAFVDERCGTHLPQIDRQNRGRRLAQLGGTIRRPRGRRLRQGIDLGRALTHHDLRRFLRLH